MDTVAAEAPQTKTTFIKLWGASGVSNLADGIGLTAAPLLAATLTRDPFLVSGLVFAQRLPWFLFTLISGALVDRLDRRQVMKIANFGRFLLLGSLGFLVLKEWINLPLLYVVFFLLGMIETLFDNAALAILPVMVSEDKLEEANGRLFATATLSNEMVGPPLGSFLFSALRSTPFFLAALAYGLSSSVLGWIPGKFTPKISLHQRGLVQEIREGVLWFWHHRLLRTLGFFAGTFNFVSAAIMGVFVLYAQDVLGLSDAAYGLLISMGAIGGIVGSLMTKKLSARFGPGSILFADAFLSGIAFLGMALTTNPFVVGIMFILISMTNMFGNVIIISLRQAIIPDHLLGRVASAYRLVVLGALPLGALFGGMIARTFSLAAPMLAGGGLLIFVAFAIQPIVNNRTIQLAKENANQYRR
jgi:MFS family permease